MKDADNPPLCVDDMKLTMRLFFAVALSVILVAAPAAAQDDGLTVRKAFAAMPDSVVPYLTANNRLDLIDFFDSNMKAEVTNTLDGKTELTALTADSLSLRLNEAVTLHMMLLPIEGAPIDSARQVIALVYVYAIPSGHVECSTAFYSATWRRLAGQHEPKITGQARKRIDQYLCLPRQKNVGYRREN